MTAFNKISSFLEHEEAILKWLLSLVLVSIPLKHGVNSILLISTLMYVIYLRIKSPSTVKPSPIHYLLISFYFVSLLSIFWTVDYEKSMNGIVQKLPYLALPLIFIWIPKRVLLDVSGIFRNFSIAMILYALFCMALGAYYSILFSDSSYLFYHSLSGNLNAMSAIYLSIMVAVAILFFLYRETGNLRFIGLFILGVFLILLSSKTVLISMILIVFTKLFLGQLKIKERLTALFVILVLVMTLFLSKNLLNRFSIELKSTYFSEILTTQDFGHVYYWTGTGLRLFQTKMFAEIMTENKVYLHGLGIDASQKLLTSKYQEYNLYPGFYEYDFHNQYVQTLSELGLIGGTLLILFLLNPLLKAWATKNFFFLGFILLIAAICFTESYLWRQRGMVFFLTILLLFYRQLQQEIKPV